MSQQNTWPAIEVSDKAAAYALWEAVRVSAEHAGAIGTESFQLKKGAAMQATYTAAALTDLTPMEVSQIADQARINGVILISDGEDAAELNPSAKGEPTFFQKLAGNPDERDFMKTFDWKSDEDYFDVRQWVKENPAQLPGNVGMA